MEWKVSEWPFIHFTSSVINCLIAIEMISLCLIIPYHIALQLIILYNDYAETIRAPARLD